MSYAFTLPFKVRDYECDLQGIVNNSVYQNYLEHARHEFLLSRGFSFAELSRQGINLVVARIEIDYKTPLRSGDEFWVGLNVAPKSKIRGVFSQNLYRQKDNRLCVAAQVEWTAINPQGRPFMPPEISLLYAGLAPSE